MRSHLTIRKLPSEVARELDEESRKRGVSLNQTVIELLRRALGLDRSEPYDNGLARLSGGWSAADLEEFDHATAAFEQVDPELWQ